MGKGPQDNRSPALKHDGVEASMHNWVTFRDVRQCLVSLELGASPAPMVSAEGSWVLGLPKRTHPHKALGCRLTIVRHFRQHSLN